MVFLVCFLMPIIFICALFLLFFCWWRFFSPFNFTFSKQVILHHPRSLVTVHTNIVSLLIMGQVYVRGISVVFIINMCDWSWNINKGWLIKQVCAQPSKESNIDDFVIFFFQTERRRKLYQYYLTARNLRCPL